jgi:hypothetical protein
MNDEILQQVEREVLAWPGVTKETFAGGRSQSGFQVPAATMYRYGRRELGHLHVTGTADLPVPQKVYQELVASGRAQPHPAGFKGVVTYTIRTAADVPGAIALFRLKYERAKATHARTAA